jgi:hypothetical protein
MNTPAKIEGSPLRILAAKRMIRALLEPREYSVRKIAVRIPEGTLTRLPIPTRIRVPSHYCPAN